MRNTTKGWLCVSGGMINLSLSYFSYTLVILFLPLLAEQLGCSLAQASLIFTTSAIASMVASMFLGPIVADHNPKGVYLFGAAGTAVMFLAIAYAPALEWVLAASILFGVANKCNGTLSYQVLATEWFRVGRGTVATMATVVSGLSNTLLSPVAGAAVMHLGLRQAALAAAMLLLVLTAVVTMLMICRGPSYYGMEPIDFNFVMGKTRKRERLQRVAAPYEFAMPASRLLRIPLVWALLLCPMLMLMAERFFYTNEAAIYASMGFDVAQASIMLSVVYIGSMIVVPLFGFLSDRFGPKRILLTYCLIGAVNMFLFPLWCQTGFVGGAILAFFYNVGTVGLYFGSVVTTPLFGLEKSPVLIGWTQVVTSAGSAISPPLAAAMYEWSGSCVLPLAVAGLCYLAAFAIAFFCLSKKSQDYLEKLDEPYKRDELCSELK